MAGIIAKKNQAKLAEQIFKQTHCKFELIPLTLFSNVAFFNGWFCSDSYTTRS